MTISNIVMDGLTTLIREFSADRFEQQVNQTCKLLDSGALKKEQANGAEITPYVITGSHAAVTWIGDFDSRPRGTAIKPAKGRVLPANIHATLSMGQVATLARLGDEGLSDLFDANLQNVADSVALHLGKGLYGQSASPRATAAWTGTTANSTVTLSFNDISMFTENQTVNFNDVSATKSYTVRVQSVTPAAAGSFSAAVGGTVVFINDVVKTADGNDQSISDSGAVTVATTDTFSLRGAYPGDAANSVTATGDRINSFDDICGSGATSDFMSVTVSANPGFVGLTRALSTAYNQEAVASFFMQMQQRSGALPTHVVMSPQVAAAHAASTGIQGAPYFGLSLAATAARPLSVDGKADKYSMLSKGYESGLTVCGRPVIVDPCIQATTILFHNDKYAKLAVWKELGPDEEAGDPVLLNRSTFSVDVYYTGSMNLYCTKRSAFGTITGLTSL